MNIYNKRLTEEAYHERADFINRYGYRGNCSCHLSPPCSSCMHPGNPQNQEEDATAWEDDCLDFEAMEKAAQARLADQLDIEVWHHREQMLNHALMWAVANGGIDAYRAKCHESRISTMFATSDFFLSKFLTSPKVRNFRNDVHF